MLHSTQKNICDQDTAITKNDWLSDIEMAMIERKMEDDVQSGEG